MIMDIGVLPHLLLPFPLSPARARMELAPSARAGMETAMISQTAADEESNYLNWWNSSTPRRRNSITDRID